MKKRERLVFYYDLSISASSRTFAAAKSISAKKAFDLMQLVPLDQRFKELSKGHEFIYVSDWERCDDIISILINKSDKGMSDPVFTVPKEKRRRTAEKQEEEGQDFSIHMIIKLPENDLKPALLITEYCVGLSMSTVKKLLDQILIKAKNISPDNFKQLHPDGAIDDKGKPKRYDVAFKCELDGHISNDLKYDLDHGKVQSIELITEKEQHTHFDEDGYIQEKCKILALTLKDDGHPVVDKFNRIVNVFKNNTNEYSRAKVRFKTPMGLSRTVEMNTAEGLAQTYVKKEKLDGFDIDLKSSYAKFNAPILAKMKELLLSGSQ